MPDSGTGKNKGYFRYGIFTKRKAGIPSIERCLPVYYLLRELLDRDRPMNEVADCLEKNADTEFFGFNAAELAMDTRDEILSVMVICGFLSYHEGNLRHQIAK